MKKIISVLMILTMTLTLLCGCKDGDTASSDISNSSSSDNNSENTDSSTEIYRDHQELTASEIVFDDNNMMRISIPEVELENVFVQEKFNSERVCAEEYGDVYLLADDRYGGGGFPTDIYLAIQCGDKLYVKDLLKWDDIACHLIDIELCDVDGNPDVEIILNVDTGGVGGMGSYLSRVFDFKDGEIIEMFSSFNENNGDFDTGYSITILKDRMFKIENKYTGYSEIFNDVREVDEYSIYYWYNHETGEPKSIDLWVDSFYQFSPIDIDQDGVYEILCRQYVCLVTHADGLGTAKTILKYNNDTSQFEIIDTEFENDSYYI